VNNLQPPPPLCAEPDTVEVNGDDADDAIPLADNPDEDVGMPDAQPALPVANKPKKPAGTVRDRTADLL
jgi:hypothetical protein